jgi:hypothetical protein
VFEAVINRTVRLPETTVAGEKHPQRRLRRHQRPGRVFGNTITGNRAGIVSTGGPVAPDDANAVSGNREADLVADRGQVSPPP